MSFRRPIIRCLLPCELIERKADGSTTLRNPWFQLTVAAGMSYPRMLSQVDLYVQLTSATGNYDLRTQIVRLRTPDEFARDEEEYTILEIPSPGMLKLSDDPLLIHEFVVPLRNILFDLPGIYEFRLVCLELSEPILGSASFALL